MKLLRHLTIAVAASTLALPLAMADDAKAMIGTWKAKKVELAGKAMPDAFTKSITLKVTSKGYEVYANGNPTPDVGTVVVDEKSKPKGMTIKSSKGPNAGKTIPTIYELKGDTMRVCYDLSGAKRPTEFKSKEGTQLFLVTYQRQK